MSIDPVYRVAANATIAGTTAGTDAAAPISALDQRVKNALGKSFSGFRNGVLPVVERFDVFNRGLQQIPLLGTQGMDQAAPETEVRKSKNRTAVYDYIRDFRFTPDGTGNTASLLVKATALMRARETLRDQERQAMLDSGALPTQHAETLAATLDTTFGVLSFIDTSFNLSFMQSMLMGDEEFEIEKEW